MDNKQAVRVWERSFFTGVIAPRYLLTPLGIRLVSYSYGTTELTYRDVYIFGLRIARIHYIL